ncbi:MAG: PHP domain-containing protein [Acutalibacteraceae bacterium]|nr:PHP domain-containing protein [Acutalibacteraceae bacterium]
MLEFNNIAEDDVERINSHYFGMDKSAYFEITPKIIQAGKRSRITIRSSDSCMWLSGTYLAMVVPYYEYSYVPFMNYKDEIFEIAAKDGVLSFEYDFLCEQMYRIIIGEKTEKGLGVLLKTAVYALQDDLFSLIPLVGDFHSHTIHSDGLDSPESVLNSAIRLGLDFIAITDHNNYTGSVDAMKIAKNKNLPITVINGEEYSSTFTNMHIISLGAEVPLDEKHYCIEPDSENTKLSTFELTKQLCQKIKENGGVSVMCHPLWKPFHSDGSRIDVPMSLVKELMENNVFDAIEIVGGSKIQDTMTSQMHHLWAVNYGATPDKTAYLGSTDSHTYSIDPIGGKHFTLVLSKSNTQKDIIDAIRNRLTVAVEIIDENNASLYGCPRYCMFAQFYLKEILKRIQSSYL